MAETLNIPRLVETLTAAFMDDPLMAWIFDDATRRPAQLDTWWTWILEHRGSHVDVLESPDGRSAALWHAPGPVDESHSPSFPEMLASLVGTDDAMRKLRGLAVIPAARPQERHWYLAAVGTRPQFQGTGSGRLVLRPVLERCDTEATPAYLESSNPRNLPFYERLGFVATGVIQVPGGPALTPMWRAPA